MARPVVTLIAAVSEDGFISRGKGVPWDLPEDRAHFRRYTAGKWLLLGRTTYEEMLGWFHDHTPLVMTRDARHEPAIGKRVSSVAEAIALAEQAAQDELVVVGGGQIFAEAMPSAQRLVITHVADRLGAGVAFPEIDPHEWTLVKSEPHSGALAFSFEEYERRA
jgi:dihydrofolate reductase